MTIRARGNTFQVDVVHNGKRARKQAKSMDEARALEAELLLSLMRPVVVAAAPKITAKALPKTLGELSRYTERHVWKGTKGEVTASINARDVVNALGADLPIDNITADMVDAMIEYFESLDLEPATVNRKLAALSSMLTVAEQRKLITHRPYISFRKESAGRIRWMTEVEQVEIVGLLRGWYMDAIADLLVFGVHTGLRLGEMLKLQVRDCQNGMITVWDSKNSESRSVPLNKISSEIIASRLSGSPTSLVFGEVRVHHITNAIELLRDAMGLEGDARSEFVWHALTRHTCASRMVQRGVPLLAVKEVLGHKSLKTTQRYAHLAPKNLQHAVAALCEEVAA